jgi:outer membrane protein OmpA-like peptidoglycan-associated protein
LGEVAQLIIKAFGLKGGIMYSLFPVPHYACRTLVYAKIIRGRTDPGGRLDGRAFLQILGRVLNYVGDNEAPAAAVSPEIPIVTEDTSAAEARRRFLQAERQRMAEEINTRLEAMNVQDTRAAATSEGVTISLSKINFQANSTRLEVPEQDKIWEIAEILKNIPQRNLLIVGHTALAGTRGAQLRTSTERAQAVADYLVQLGARMKEEITVRGYGADIPVADNTTAEGMDLNRRVEITILEEEP